MAVAVRVLTGAYHDSVKLMRISAAACERPGVRQAVVLMGTPMNLEQLASIGLLSEEAQRAGPNDLVLAVEAEGSGGGARRTRRHGSGAERAPRSHRSGSVHESLRTDA